MAPPLPDVQTHDLKVFPQSVKDVREISRLSTAPSPDERVIVSNVESVIVRLTEDAAIEEISE